MTSPLPTRPPRAFSPEDPALELAVPEGDDDAPLEPPAVKAGTAVGRAGASVHRRGVRWGAILLSSLAALATLGIGVWFARLTAVVLDRQDWAGWVAYGLLIVAAISALMLALRECLGLMRLSRLASLRRDVRQALDAHDAKAERACAGRLEALYAPRPELRWALARMRDHKRDVRDPGQLLALADRELIAPLDISVRKLIAASAKRVALVTAMSPMAALAVLYVLFENLRLLRGIAGLYGGRPGTAGGLRLARMVAAHIIATGGIALTDDILGQFLGQDLLHRLSRRLGEGAFNGALTARIGVAAIEVCRPLPFIEAAPVRLRDLLVELFRRKPVPGSTDA